MDLSITCAVAFLTVISVLALLAACIRLLSLLFPHCEDAPVTRAASALPHQEIDAATLAAIQIALDNQQPGARLISVEPR